MIYLDNASTTMIDLRVYEEMEPFLKGSYGNPGSVHQLGVEAKKAVNLARERVARAINANPDEIIFTSGGSESNNLAVKFVSDICGSTDILSSKLEHDSMKNAILEYGYINELLPYYNPEDMIECVNNHYLAYDALSFMFVNNELGVINPVDELCKIGADAGYITIVDGVQALGNEEIDVKKIDCDLLSLSSHKIHGPKGVGALYIRRGFKEENRWLLKPMIFGGENQEFGLRGGTENVAGIVGFGKACKLIDVWKSKEKITELRKELISGFKFNYRINFDRDDSKIISLTIPGVDAETLVLLLSAKGVCISAGSACKSLEQKPNEVLLAANFTESDARNTVRVSLSTMNTIEEMELAADIINECVHLLGGR